MEAGDDRSDLRALLAQVDPAAAPAGGARPDPFFVGRVMAVLPSPLRGSRLSPARRARVLAGFYAAAVMLAALMLWLAPDAWPESLGTSLVAWSEQAHGLADDASLGSWRGGAWETPWLIGLGVLALFGGVALALVPARVDTPAT